jgi:hypothetical protein
VAKKEMTAFNLIKERYFQLDKDFDLMMSACKNDEEKKQLKQDYIISRANYRKSLNLNFEENDPIVKDLTGQLAKLEDRINKDIKNLGITANIFNMISESVKIASSIIVVVMSLV